MLLLIRNPSRSGITLLLRQWWCGLHQQINSRLLFTPTIRTLQKVSHFTPIPEEVEEDDDSGLHNINKNNPGLILSSAIHSACARYFIYPAVRPSVSPDNNNSHIALWRNLWLANYDQWCWKF